MQEWVNAVQWTSFIPVEEDLHHGAEPVVLPIPHGGSHPHLPPHPCRVARQATPSAPAATRTLQAPTQTLRRTQALSRTDPQTAVRGLCTGSRGTRQGAGLATSAHPFHPRSPTDCRYARSLLSRPGLLVSRLARPW